MGHQQGARRRGFLRRPAHRTSDRKPTWGAGRRSAAVTAAALAAGVLAACGSDGPRETAQAFLDGWRGGRLDSLAFVRPDGSKLAAAEVAAQLAALSGELRTTPPNLKLRGGPKTAEKAADFAVDVDWGLPGGARWRYGTALALNRVGEEWAVVWQSAVVHPDLVDGEALGTERVPAPRGPVQDAAGRPLITDRPVVVVGVQPGRVADVKKLVPALAAAFKLAGVTVDLAGLPAQVAKADKDAFVEVVTLRQPDYNKIRNRIQPLAGTVFREEHRQLAPSRTFARAVLGTVDPVQRDDMAGRPGAYALGDQVGHGGLQGRYEDRLRGTAGQRIVARSSAPGGSAQARELHRIEPVAGQPVKSSLEPAVQAAAELALAGTTRRAALVAVRVRDGAVLAAANAPAGAAVNLAFTAQVPPGSTFKMVSALALLDRGAVTPATPVACPKTVAAGGRTFKNANNFALGTVPFRVDFAQSCNTAFASLAPRLGPGGLAEAGASLGIGQRWDVGLDAASGTVSRDGDPAEQAAAAFGQGRTVVSPLAMAAATAAVARGSWRPPSFVLDPLPDAAAPQTPSAGVPGATAAPTTAPPAPVPSGGPAAPLRAASVQALHAMMREVVTDGTAAALRGVPGGPVYGKTGTAEFDNNPAHTHAWFVGWRGDVAIAVFVENGGGSGATAVPLAGRFLTAVRG
ncbi:cell division protein FtsI [Pilimelia terevasa]|uniref:Cell division protein FtsI n=1 Tax=Pilimelia terevasa TaxID=53372 RepID=A0A8J3FGZ9_9ACTN|nr:penicillin-binding transpeptidase domain-containing protein [Pilimelia terevasa]GGK19240.1 cell division protein FtsI [Pilimelia terevasa]